MHPYSEKSHETHNKNTLKRLNEKYKNDAEFREQEK